jgi:hypothetical protein
LGSALSRLGSEKGKRDPQKIKKFHVPVHVMNSWIFSLRSGGYEELRKEKFLYKMDKYVQYFVSLTELFAFLPLKNWIRARFLLI